MEWVGHADSAMVRHYFHLHDEESKRQMCSLNLLGESVGRSDGAVSKSSKEEQQRRTGRFRDRPKRLIDPVIDPVASARIHRSLGTADLQRFKRSGKTK